jgi:hypothetical protein
MAIEFFTDSRVLIDVAAVCFPGSLPNTAATTLARSLHPLVETQGEP